jgi:C-terminal processing protease CtpA/Prc
MYLILKCLMAHKRLVLIAAFSLLLSGSRSPIRAQSLAKADIDRGLVMARTIKVSLKDNYYDSSFRGMDLDADFKEAEATIRQAKSYGDMYEAIANTLGHLKDSHTYLVPPLSSVRVEYGWRIQMIGNKCYVVAVKSGSDAEAKGLRTGDEVLSVFGTHPTRENLWLLNYLYNRLKHMTSVGMIAQAPDGQRRGLELIPEIHQDKQVFDFGRLDAADSQEAIRRAQNARSQNPHRYYELGNALLVWKMPKFNLDESEVDNIMDKVRRRDALILDLRGNPGGYELTLLRLLGQFFDHDIKIGDIKQRKGAKPLIAKSSGKNPFKGKLIVLVDSKTGSAAEMLARVVQIEKRGIVVGDRSAGEVMRSKLYRYRVGLEMVMTYAVSITDADILMPDGHSLENVGVTPDELKLPTAADLAGNRDPVLSYAASLVGFKIDPEKAGALFPQEWPQ